jgi:hypothetical protein
MKRLKQRTIPTESRSSAIVFSLSELLDTILRLVTNGGDLQAKTMHLRTVNRLFCHSIPRVMTKCHLRGPCDRFLHQLPNLTEISLYDNRISTSTLSRLTSLIALRLHCAYQSAYDSNRSLVKSIPHIRRLYVHGYHTLLPHDTLANLTRLDTLTIQNCWLPSQYWDQVKSLTRLELLDNTAFDDNDLARFTSLRSLTIDGRGVYPLWGDTLHSIESLTELSLCNGCRVTCSILSELSQLRSLSLYKTPLITTGYLVRMTNLTKLRLRLVDHISTDSLTTLTNLTHLDI